MAHPLLRRLVARLRGMQTAMLHRHLLQRMSRPMELPKDAALVIAPHQDDETFACGGLIAMKRRAGIPVSVVFVTDGRASHPPETISKEQLVAQRKREGLDATAILGVASDEVYFLDGEDGALPALSQTEHDRLVKGLADILDRTGATEVYVPHRSDRHPDHEATFRLTTQAIQASGASRNVYEYPVWLLWRRGLPSFPTRDAAGAGRLDVTSVCEIKKRAITIYQTQLPGMPPGFLPQFRGSSEFFFGPKKFPSRVDGRIAEKTAQLA